MSQESQDDSVHEAPATYAGTLADVVHVQLDIPRDVWARLTQWATIHQIGETEAAVQLLEQQVAALQDQQGIGYYAALVGQHLRGELEPGPRLAAIQVDEDVARAIRLELGQEYGSDDPVEIIARMRDRS
jgi:hypothetical protein